MQKQKFWDWVGESISSLGAVLLPMIILITGGMFLSHTYFRQTLPDTMAFWEAFLSAWLIAIAWELTVLVTTVNQKHVKRWIPRVMAIFSGIIFLFYIGAFDENLSMFSRLQKGFVGALVSLVSYIYVELFNAKWSERVAGRTLPDKLIEAERKFNESQSAFNELERRFNETHSTLIEAERKLNESERLRASLKAELTCPHCLKEFESHGTVHAHKGHCEKNPNKKQKIKIVNGFHKP